MSRSYKKHPWCCDRNPYAKNQANRKIRHGKINEEIPSGKAYKKYYCSWNICDWKTYKPFSYWRKIAMETIAEDLNKDDAVHGYRTTINYWEECFKRK